MTDKEKKTHVKNLRNRMMTIFIICLVIVLAIIASTNMFIASLAEKNREKSIQYVDEQIVTLYTCRILSLDSLVNTLTQSELLKKYDKNDFYVNEPEHDTSEIFSYLAMLAASNELVDYVTIYNYKYEHMITDYGNINEKISANILASYISAEGELIPFEKLNKYRMWYKTDDYVLVTYKADLINRDFSKNLFITLNIPLDKLSELLDSITVTDNSKNALLYRDSFLFLNHDLKDMDYSLLHYAVKKMHELKEGEQVTFEYDYAWYYLQLRELDEENGLSLLYLIPDNEVADNVYEFTTAISLIVSAIILIVGYVVFQRILNVNVQKPLSNLVAGMEKVGSGDFTNKLDENIAKDNEIKELFIAYNSMTNRVTVLIEELFQAELYRKQLELQSLQDKIDPHFLYNTLDTINWAAKEHNVDEISKIVVALSTMYRKIFNRGRDLTTIKDALEGISCYLDIQRIRYGESFSYNISCPEQLENHVILNLIIQTIVENAIVHGLEDRQSGRLEICVSKEKDDIMVKVTDNGIGMTEEKLNLINASINSTKLEGESGLRNVQRRIKLYYGPEYGIRISSVYKEGTKVELRVPARERESKND